MRAHTTQIGSLIVALAGATAAFAGPGVVEFEHNAGGWLASVSGEDLHAFDQFRPGVQSASACLAGTPGTSLYLAKGVLTLGKFQAQGAPGCAVSDGSTAPAVSDGSLTDQAMFVMDFSPPVSAFYTYYGSLAVGETVTMSLYSNGTLVTQLESDQSFDNVDAAGHGFVSDVLIDRIEFTSTDSGGVLVGAFTGLLGGEGSLGTVLIPGYPGPDGETVQVDFGLVFTPDCNDNGVDDAEDIAQGGTFDTNGNGLPDECEFSGSLNGAVVWESGSTVYLASDISVAGSLTVEPGVDVVPAAGVEIVVQAAGQLTINGTGAQPVRLRPVGADRWDGIRFAGGAGALRHAELERLNTAGITIEDAAPLVDSCTIRDVAPPADPAPPVTNCCSEHPGTGCNNAACEAVVCAVYSHCCNDAWDSICAYVAQSMCGVCSSAAKPGASAYGVRVLGSSDAVISSSVIQGLTGADGFAGSNGSGGSNGGNGANGGGGQECVAGGYDGDPGGWGDFGGWGVPGQTGGDAIGVYVGPGASVQLASCRINNLQAGNGGQGGNSGSGGAGGAGGNGTGGFACGGDGGYAGGGGYGGAAGDGGRGGDALGVHLEAPGDSVVAQNVITHLVAGSGANGGNGGNGGAGGHGGDGAFNLFDGGSGGSGGWGGDGGAAGDGGRGGRSQPISVVDHASILVLSQNTVGGNLTRGTAGVAGVPGSGGAPGSGGSGAATGGSDGSTGNGGFPGAFGVNGVIGNAVGINASAGPSPVITASNNIIVPGNAGYSVGMQAEGNAVIVGDFTCFFDFNVMVSGGVAPGGGSFVANPSFVDTDGIDDLPGTEDDNRRLAQGSACVNTAGNAAIPPDAADLDGDANTAEPLPRDADGNPRIIGAVVDVGAYEFGSAPVPCPWDVNGDGTVNTVDFLSLLQQWGTDPGGPPDINGDGTVNTVDFLALLQHWGPCP